MVRHPLLRAGAADRHTPLLIESTLSDKWHRCAIRRAAGIAQSWLSNRDRAWREYQEALAEYDAHPDEHAPDEPLPPGCRVRFQMAAGTQTVTSPDGTTRPYRTPPTWTEPSLPHLTRTVLLAENDVATLRHAEEADAFPFWLRVSTLTAGARIDLPVTLADYHLDQLAGHDIDGDVYLIRRENGWWLQLSYHDQPAATSDGASPAVGVDVGIASFLTTSLGDQYGTFRGKLARRHQRDREQRRRKAKLRACLKKKGVTKLPSLTNQRLARHVRQEINRAVKAFFRDYAGFQVAYEDLAVRTMRFKTRRMNAYLYASNLGHLPKQLAWGAKKRGMKLTAINPAYTSQECPVCHHVARANRPNQQTFCCGACSYTAHADEVGAGNILARLTDAELRTCSDTAAIKALLGRRHRDYSFSHELPAVQPPAQIPATGPSGAGHHRPRRGNINAISSRHCSHSDGECKISRWFW
ncbi:MAG: transposase [Chloroflexaceae bacterium]|nr:transposase [Chloroflexaceae bacterium]